MKNSTFFEILCKEWRIKGSLALSRKPFRLINIRIASVFPDCTSFGFSVNTDYVRFVLGIEFLLDNDNKLCRQEIVTPKSIISVRPTHLDKRPSIISTMMSLSL